MDDEKRCTIEESLIQACKEINLMRKGLLPEPTLDELWAILEKELAEDEAVENKDDFNEEA